MAKKLKHAGETPLGCLARLERDYPIIDRAPLKRALQEAIQQQRKLDQFVNDHGITAQAWKARRRHLEQRRLYHRKAAASHIAEIEESFFDDFMKSLE